MTWLAWLARDWQRPSPSRPELRRDLVLGVVWALLSVFSLWVYLAVISSYNDQAQVENLPEAFSVFALAGLVLGLHRRFPLTVLVISAVIFVLVSERFEDLVGNLTVQMTFFAAMYSAWAWSRRPRSLYLVSATVLVGMFGWVIWDLSRPDTLPPGPAFYGMPPEVAVVIYSLAVNILYFFGAVAWGHSAWLSARRRAMLEAQFERERHHQMLERAQAIRAERVRIARDLHDVVAHHVSGIGIQATGARRVLERDPMRAAEALETIETSSRQAVAQMHQLVGLLREADDESSTREPQPGLCDISGLADPLGVPRIEFELVGEPYETSPTVALNLYRVAQEAVTNARRHSLARRVLVSLRYLDDSIEIEIVDDGRGVAHDLEAVALVHSTGGGFGLAGIRERATMLDGELELGNRPQGGYRVRLRIPTEGTS